MEKKNDPIPFDEDKYKRAGKKIQQAGCSMTLLLTLPIVGFATLGIGGLIIGLALGVIIFAGIQSKDKKPDGEKQD